MHVSVRSGQVRVRPAAARLDDGACRSSKRSAAARDHDGLHAIERARSKSKKAINGEHAGAVHLTYNLELIFVSIGNDERWSSSFLSSLH